MTTADVETVLQRARERFPEARPRIISDNGPAFVAKEFKAFIRLAGMTHVRTSPYDPQSNGQMQRWYQTFKGTTLRPAPPDSPERARRMVRVFVAYYHHERLHSAIGCLTPADLLAGRALGSRSTQPLHVVHCTTTHESHSRGTRNIRSMSLPYPEPSQLPP